MKQRYTILSIFLFCTFFIFINKGSFAQSASTKKIITQAEELVYDGKYAEAKAKYFEAYRADSNNYKVSEGLGLFLAQYLDDKELALGYLHRALKLNNDKDTVPELMYTYAQCCQYSSNYDEAINYYTRTLNFITKNKAGTLQRLQILKYIENCKFSKSTPAVKNLARYKVRNLGDRINTKNGEYAPISDKTENVLVYESRRKDTSATDDGVNENYFESILISTKEHGRFGHSEPFNYKNGFAKTTAQNTTAHEPIVSISSDGKTIVALTKSGLYQSKNIGGTWEPAQLLSEIINAPENTEAHAFMTKDGLTLYFSSNKEGGYGGLDIYRTVKRVDGTWATPENLGPAINTKDDDDSPFLSADGLKFYYSSKGFNGYGGYDIYRINIENGVYGAPENIGTPFNSPADDIYFSINEDETSGFLSSSRKGGHGDLDIYRVFYFDKPNNTCIPMKDAKKTDDIYIDFTCRDSIFVNDTVLFNSANSTFKNAEVQRKFWKINDSIVATDSTSILKKFTKPGIYSITLQVALLSDTCTERLDFCVNKQVHVFDPKEVDDFYEPLVSKGEESIVIQGTVDVITLKMDSTKKEVKKIKLEPVFFNSDKFDLTKDAVAAINRNIAKMKVDKNIVIKITSHTDAKASKEYNLKLSQKRANSVIAYLEKKGIKRTRILAVVAKGEVEPVNKCKDDVKCNEEQNRRNRRVEFKIVGTKMIATKAATTKKKAPTKKATTKKAVAKKKK